MRVDDSADFASAFYSEFFIQNDVRLRIRRGAQFPFDDFSVQIDDDHSVARQFGIRDARRLYRKHAFSRIECGNVAPRVHGEIVFGDFHIRFVCFFF